MDTTTQANSALMTDAPLSYNDASRVYNQLQSQPEFQGMSEKDFALHMEKNHGDSSFRALANNGVVPTLARDWDAGMQATGATSAGRAAGGAIGSVFGERGRQIGEQQGEGFPDLIGAILGTGALTATGVGAIPAAITVGSLLGAKNYGAGLSAGETQRQAAASGLVSGATFPLFGPAEGLGESLGAKLGAKLFTENAAEKSVQSLAERALQYGGGQVAQVGLMEASDAATHALAGTLDQYFDSLTTPEHYLGTAIGVAPFLAKGAGEGLIKTLTGRQGPSGAQVLRDNILANEKGRFEQTLASDNQAQQTDFKPEPVIGPAIPPEVELGPQVPDIFQSKSAKDSAQSILSQTQNPEGRGSLAIQNDIYRDQERRDAYQKVPSPAEASAMFLSETHDELKNMEQEGRQSSAEYQRLKESYQALQAPETTSRTDTQGPFPVKSAEDSAKTISQTRQEMASLEAQGRQSSVEYQNLKQVYDSLQEQQESTSFQNSSSTLEPKSSEESAGPIDQRLSSEERLRQSPQGAESLKEDLSEKEYLSSLKGGKISEPLAHILSAGDNAKLRVLALSDDTAYNTAKELGVKFLDNLSRGQINDRILRKVEVYKGLDQTPLVNQPQQGESNATQQTTASPTTTPERSEGAVTTQQPNGGQEQAVGPVRTEGQEVVGANGVETPEARRKRLIQQGQAFLGGLEIKPEWKEQIAEVAKTPPTDAESSAKLLQTNDALVRSAQKDSRIREALFEEYGLDATDLRNYSKNELSGMVDHLVKGGMAEDKAVTQVMGKVFREFNENAVRVSQATERAKDVEKKQTKGEATKQGDREFLGQLSPVTQEILSKVLQESRGREHDTMDGVLHGARVFIEKNGEPSTDSEKKFFYNSLRKAENNKYVELVRRHSETSLDREVGEGTTTLGDIMSEGSTSPDYKKMEKVLNDPSDPFATQANKDTQAERLRRVYESVMGLDAAGLNKLRGKISKFPNNPENFLYRIKEIAKGQMAGETYEEIAKRVGLATNSIADEIARTKEVFRAVLSEQGLDKRVSKAATTATETEKGHLTFLATAQDWLSKYYVNRGYDMGSKEHSAMVSRTLRIAASLRDVAGSTLGTVGGKDENNRGLFGVNVRTPDMRSNQTFVGLNDNPALQALFGISDKLVGPLEHYHTGIILGHEMWHAVEEMHEDGVLDVGLSEKIDKAYAYIDKLSPEEKSHVMESALKAAIPTKLMSQDGVRKYVLDRAANASGSTEEFASSLAGVLLTGMSEGSDQGPRIEGVKDFIRYAPQVLSNFVRGVFVKGNELLDGVVGLIRGQSKLTSVGLIDKEGSLSAGTLLAGDPARQAFMEQTIRSFNDAVKDAARTKEEIDAAVASLQKMQQGATPEEYGKWLSELGQGPGVSYNFSNDQFSKTSFAQASKDVQEAMGQSEKSKEELFGTNPMKIASALVAPQFKELYPVVRPIMDLIYTYRAEVNKATSQLLAPFFSKDRAGAPIKDNQASNTKDVAKNPIIRDKLSEIIADQSLNGVQWTDDQIRQKVGDAWFDRVKQVRDSISKAGMMGAQIDISKEQTKLGHDVAWVMGQKDKNMPAQEALDKGRVIVGALIDSSDPVKANGAKAQLDAVARTMDPIAFSAAVEHASSFLPAFQKLKEVIGDNPNYFNEARNGKFMLSWMDKSGEKHFFGFDTQQKATDRYNLLVRQGATDIKAINQDVKSGVEPMNAETASAFAALDQARFDAAKKLVADPDALAEFEKAFTPGQGVIEAQAGKSFAQHFLQKKFVGGREELDALDQTFKYLNNLSYSVAKQLVVSEMNVRANDPSLRAQPYLRDLAKQQLQYSMSPKEGKVFTRIRQFAGFYMMGSNLSTSMIEAAQPLLSLAPMLTQHGAEAFGFPAVIAAEKKAVEMLSLGFLKEGTANAWDVESMNKFTKNPDLSRDLLRAKQEGVIDLGIYEEFKDPANMDLINLRRAGLDLSPLEKAGKLATNGSVLLGKWSRMIQAKTEEHNSLVAFLAGHELASREGSTLGDPYEFARRTAEAANFGGGPAGRPMVFSRVGEAAPVLGLMYTMQHYVASMVGTMGRLAVQSLRGNPESAMAQKALGQMVLTTMLSAGALGMPLAGGTIALIDSIFPFQIAKNLREFIAGLMGQDHEAGAMLADGVLKGLPTMLGPTDVSARLGLGTVLGLQDNAGYDATSLIGPIGSIVANVGRGITTAATGDVLGGARQAMPTAWKNAMSGYTGVSLDKDTRGNKIFDPTETQKVLSAIGFHPKEVTDYYEQKSMMNQSSEINARELQNFHRQLAMQMNQGDMQGVREALLAKQKSLPTYSAAAGAGIVAKLAQAQRTPVDLLRESSLQNAQDAIDIAQTYGQRGEGVSEVQRLIERTMKERQLGIAGAGQITPSALHQAAVVDAMMSQYNITKSQASLVSQHSAFAARARPSILQAELAR